MYKLQAQDENEFVEVLSQARLMPDDVQSDALVKSYKYDVDKSLLTDDDEQPEYPEGYVDIFIMDPKLPSKYDPATANPGKIVASDETCLTADTPAPILVPTAKYPRSETDSSGEDAGEAAKASNELPDAEITHLSKQHLSQQAVKTQMEQLMQKCQHYHGTMQWQAESGHKSIPHMMTRNGTPLG